MIERDMKKCQQCGEIRPIEDFRTYYNKNKNKPPGRYKICKHCESLNQRYKYLTSKHTKNTITEEESAEREQIEQIYAVLREAGLKPPGYSNLEQTPSIVDEFKAIMAKRLAEIEQKQAVGTEGDTPQELVDWLTKDLGGYHPDQLEDVYDKLHAKYRQKIGVDEFYKPVYDDTYRDILFQIDDRFEEYKESFWDE